LCDGTCISSVAYDSRGSDSDCREASWCEKIPIHSPVIIATAVALIGLVALLLLDHGPWNKPNVKNEIMIQYGTTATAAGAAVTPTEQKPELEPVVPGPKPVQPAIPDPNKS
jgi:hypothetical protein